MNNNDLLDHLITLLEAELSVYRKDVNESTMGTIVGLVRSIDILKKVKENGAKV